jgi:hypothetical protein
LFPRLLTTMAAFGRRVAIGGPHLVAFCEANCDHLAVT